MTATELVKNLQLAIWTFDETQLQVQDFGCNSRSLISRFWSALNSVVHQKEEVWEDSDTHRWVFFGYSRRCFLWLISSCFWEMGGFMSDPQLVFISFLRGCPRSLIYLLWSYAYETKPPAISPCFTLLLVFYDLYFVWKVIYICTRFYTLVLSVTQNTVVYDCNPVFLISWLVIDVIGVVLIKNMIGVLIRQV